MKSKKILVTGAAGFIGFHTVHKLVKLGFSIVGIDNINDYYPMTLKFDRLKELGIDSNFIRYNNKVKSNKNQQFEFLRLDITDEHNLLELFRTEKFDCIIHLAAQAGVRYSLDNPNAYIESNIKGFLNILEATRHFPVKHLVYASSSSVYGQNKEQPFSVEHRVDKPVSLYAATKISNELMAYSYSHLYNIPMTGLRFFTVYGPWGRPDMAPMLFANAMHKNEAIEVFNNGNLERDFTYIDDIVEGIIKVLNHIPDKNDQNIRYKIFNIGNSKPIKLLNFIETLEKAFKKNVKKIMLPMQDGDVYSTYADVTDLKNSTGYQPKTSLTEGIKLFAEWYKEYYNRSF
jgi:UDP-glucuronate 4-epimerase